ncbi:RNA methyltransferase [Spirochaetia bacterium]|nr:RNA methyltransferase [Spirochaetia bacterium]
MRNRLSDELAVCGFNAVSALGEYHAEQINRLFLREDRLPHFTGVCKKLAERKHPYKLCGDEELERICKSNRHQGVVAMIQDPEVAGASPDDLDRLAAEGKTALLLCSVGNDHNLGAMVRSAAFFDTSLVILTEADTEARLTTSAYRVAEGGMEQVTFRQVRDAAAFLKSASRSLVTIGADPRARIRIRDLPALIRKGSSAHGHPGIILALGNEEAGLPPEVKAQCSILARIPGTGAIESLNVAQAATLFLHELYEL